MNAQPRASSLVVRRLGLVDYLPTWEAMRRFTAAAHRAHRTSCGCCSTRRVYTYGVAGAAEHLPRIDNGIPVVKIDRGGQITYHGPGQVVASTPCSTCAAANSTCARWSGCWNRP